MWLLIEKTSEGELVVIGSTMNKVGITYMQQEFCRDLNTFPLYCKDYKQSEERETFSWTIKQLEKQQ